VLALEAVILLILSGRTRLRPRAVFANAAAGASLLVALRLALTASWWGYVALALAVGLIAHALDLWVRVKHGKD